MPVEARQEGQQLLVGVIRGVLRKSELDAFQKAAADVVDDFLVGSTPAAHPASQD